MLRRIGFRYAERVDPFDGGPHFTAPTDEVTLVQKAQRMKVDKVVPKLATKRGSLVSVQLNEAPYFRAVIAHCHCEGEHVTLEEDVATHLNLQAGSEAWILPLD